MKRNHYIPGLLLTIGLLAGSVLNAQPSGDLLAAGPPPPPGTPFLTGPGRLNPDNWTGIRSPYYQEMTALTTLSGTVEQLTGNEEDVLDGFTLNTGSAPPGPVDSLGGQAGDSGDHNRLFRNDTRRTDCFSTSVIWETPPVLPAVLATPTLTTVKGKVVNYQADREGRTSGLILSDQTWVRVPPLLAGQIINMAPKGSMVSVDGYIQQPGKGHFMLHKHTILQPSVLTINGQ